MFCLVTCSRSSATTRHFWKSAAEAPRASLTESVYSSTTIANPALARQRSRISWVAFILPQLERQDIWDRLVNGTGFPGLSPVEQAQNAVRPIELLICPADGDLVSGGENAGLSYVANTGAWDWRAGTALFETNDFLANQPPPPARGDTKENGLFQNRTLGKTNGRLSFSDGTTTTLMLSENIHKGSEYSWLGVPADRGGEQEFGMVWVANARPQGTTPGDPTDQARFSKRRTSTSDTTFRSTADRPAIIRPDSSM